MKRSLFPLLAVAAMTAASQAASYSSNFEAPDYPSSGNDFNGSDGWSTVNANPGVAFIATTSSSSGSSNAGAIGGQFDIPSAAGTASVNHAYAEAIGLISYSLDISVIDSGTIGSVDYFNRDSFGITLTNGGANVFTLHFTPTIAAPADPNTDTDATWDLSYSVGAGGTVPLNMAVIESGIYGLVFEFSANGTQTDLFFEATGNNVVDRSVTLNLDPNSTTTDIGFSWTPTDDLDPGSNYLAFDNVNIVPEPSSALLLGIAGLALAVRRKRG